MREGEMLLLGGEGVGKVKGVKAAAIHGRSDQPLRDNRGTGSPCSTSFPGRKAHAYIQGGD